MDQQNTQQPTLEQKTQQIKRVLQQNPQLATVLSNFDTLFQREFREFKPKDVKNQ